MMEASTAHHGMEREPNEKSSRLRLRRPAHSPSATMPTKYASKTTVSIARRASMGATYQMTNDECRMTNECRSRNEEKVRVLLTCLDLVIRISFDIRYSCFVIRQSET